MFPPNRRPQRWKGRPKSCVILPSPKTSPISSAGSASRCSTARPASARLYWPSTCQSAASSEACLRLCRFRQMHSGTTIRAASTASAAAWQWTSKSSRQWSHRSCSTYDQTVLSMSPVVRLLPSPAPPRPRVRFNATSLADRTTYRSLSPRCTRRARGLSVRHHRFFCGVAAAPTPTCAALRCAAPALRCRSCAGRRSRCRSRRTPCWRRSRLSESLRSCRRCARYGMLPQLGRPGPLLHLPLPSGCHRARRRWGAERLVCCRAAAHVRGGPAPEWTCGSCTLLNPHEALACDVCTNPRAGAAPAGTVFAPPPMHSAACTRCGYPTAQCPSFR